MLPDRSIVRRALRLAILHARLWAFEVRVMFRERAP